MRLTPRHLILLILVTLPFQVLGADQPSTPETTKHTLTLNLNEVDIRAFIATVSEVTGKNFIIDPRVKGKVTVISSKPMQADKIYDVFLSVLKIHGFATIETGSVIKIVPNVSAKQDTVPTAFAKSNTKGDALITRVIQVEYADVGQLVPILRPLLPQHAHLAAHKNSNTLLITDTAANVNRIVDIINRMDQANYHDIEIIPLKHSLSSELIKTLDSLNKKELTKGKGKTSNTPTLITDNRTNSIIISGDAGWRESIRQLILQLDVPIENDGLTEVIYLRHATAKDLANILQGVGSQQLNTKEKKKKTNEQLDIQADPATNALIVTASPAIMKSLKRVIQKLDIRRAQVHIEAVIAEMQFDKSIEFGVNWQTSQSGVSASSGKTLSPDPNTGAINFALDTFSLGYFSHSNLRFLVKALSSDDDTNILSIPSVVTLDNEEAKIHIGQNVPFITGSFTNTNTSADNPFQTVERHDIGVKLTVTPHINEGDSIRLKIVQEVSSVQDNSKTGFIITNKRLIDTTVVVDDGEILVLGGLTDDVLLEGESKVPVLGDIPIIGQLFKSRSTSYVKKNLMVFLRPKILRDSRHSQKLTHEKYDYIRNLEKGEYDNGVQMMEGVHPPILPKRFTPTSTHIPTKQPSATPDPIQIVPSYAEFDFQSFGE